MYNNIMGIRVNSNMAAREGLRQEIMQELTEVVDPETGQRVVREICKGEDYYRGPYAESTPDIVVIMDPDYGCNPNIGHYSSVITKFHRKPFGGSHRLEGIFIASGPDIISNPEVLTNLAIEDIAPTVLYLIDLPVPSDMDGRVLAEILNPTILEYRPIRYSEPVGPWPSESEAIFADEAISGEDEAGVRERLRALGYL
jgi:predicted AlkP superfamily phosphohydrolase/phosphomutase